MVAQSFGNRAQYVTAVAPSQRPVGYLLALGIFIAPYVFGWLVLRAGYSTLARVVAFGWCMAVLVAAFSAQPGRSTMHIVGPAKPSQGAVSDNTEQPAIGKDDAAVALELSQNGIKAFMEAGRDIVATPELARQCAIAARGRVAEAKHYHWKNMEDLWQRAADYCEAAR